MGQAKRKQDRHKQLLADNPYCIYCGAPATTIDHCPPRVFFRDRVAPEGYEFPACKPCNDAARIDEMSLAVLVRSSVEDHGANDPRWERDVRGVKNNNPAIIAEWTSTSQNARRRALREAFGSLGDTLRAQGYGIANLGPETQAMCERFIARLARALYFHENREVFRGHIRHSMINCLLDPRGAARIEQALAVAPKLSVCGRGSESLLDQFAYRFNNSVTQGAMYGVIWFNAQMVFIVLAARDDLMDRLASESIVEFDDTPVDICLDRA